MVGKRMFRYKWIEEAFPDDVATILLSDETENLNGYYETESEEMMKMKVPG